MLYLGIDQHRKQLTVCVRDEQGDVTLRRQVSTEWERVRAWYTRIKKRRGAKIARVAVMRRLTTILWHIVKHNEP
jgi:hypothetical protein